jgi:hypothetical protein
MRDAADAVQDEQHVLFHCTHPSLQTKYAFLYPHTGTSDVSVF